MVDYGTMPASDAGIQWWVPDMQVVKDPQQSQQASAPAEGMRANPSGDLVPLVYHQLRRLARQQLADERCGHTLQATALVHEAFLRLTHDAGNHSMTREQFFVAAADAMRKILIEHARSRGRQKRGGGRRRIPLDLIAVASEMDREDIVALDDLIQQLERHSAQAAEVVRLRFYAGLSIDETAVALGVSASTIDRTWTSARAWLWRHYNDHASS